MAATTQRRGKDAVTWARNQAHSGEAKYHNLCLKFTRECFGVAAKEPNAKKGWENAKKRHPTKSVKNIPAGVPVWFKTRTVNWHVALSAGEGYCYSSDVPRGRIGLIGIDRLCKSWGITLLGWTEDINGVTVYTKPVKPPAFPLGLKPGESNPSAIPLQKQLKKAGFLAKSVKENANYGPKTRDAVEKFHNQYPKYKSDGVSKDVKIGPKGWNFLFTNW